MNVRLAYTAPGWLLCAATSVFLAGNANAQDSQANPKKTLKSAVQREMELLLGKRGAAQVSDHRETARDSRLRPGSGNSGSNSLARRYFGTSQPKKTASSTPAKLATQTAKPVVTAQKVAAPKPVAAAAKPQTIRTVSGQKTTGRVVQTSGKSDITKELEKLYQQDGRPMPSMNIRHAPNANYPVPGYKSPAQRAQAQQQQARQSQTRPQQAPARNQAAAAQPQKKRGIGGFLSRLNPFRKRTKKTQTQPQNVAQQAPTRRPAPAATRQPNQLAVPPKAAAQPARLPKSVATKQAPALPLPPSPTAKRTRKDSIPFGR